MARELVPAAVLTSGPRGLLPYRLIATASYAPNGDWSVFAALPLPKVVGYEVPLFSDATTREHIRGLRRRLGRLRAQGLKTKGKLRVKFRNPFSSKDWSAR